MQGSIGRMTDVLNSTEPTLVPAAASGKQGSGSGAAQSEADMCYQTARVAELADAQDLGSCGISRGGSSPPSRIYFLLPIVQFGISRPIGGVVESGRAGAASANSRNL